MIPGSSIYKIMKLIYDSEISKKNNIIYRQQFYGLSNFTNFNKELIDRVFEYLLNANLIVECNFPPSGYPKGGYQVSPIFCSIMKYSEEYYDQDIEINTSDLVGHELIIAKILYDEAFSNVKECFNRKDIYSLISDEYDLSIISMDLYLKSMCDKGYLEKIGRAKYQITRKLFLYFELNRKNKYIIELENKIDNIQYQLDKHLVFDQFNMEKKNGSQEETEQDSESYMSV